jgi:hypothetical protein
VSVAEAARRLGVTPRAVRNRIRRDTIVWRPKGNEGREVFLPVDAGSEDGSADGQVTDQGDGPGDGQGSAFAGLVDALRAELRNERERREAAEMGAAVAAREVELTRELAAELRADRDRLAELLRLALHRPSWWERALRAVRGAV